MDYIKPKPWKGNDLKGEWTFTRKLDGVRMLRDEEGNPVSRAGKRLYNLDFVDKSITDAEIFKYDWESSVSAVRTQSWKISPLVESDNIYSLTPYIDQRIFLYKIVDPTVEVIYSELKAARARGDEGLVLRNGDNWLKVKPTETYDVKIIGMMEGTGKYTGMMGCLVTPMGRIGTGFTDKQRKEFWEGKLDMVWNTVEVECLHLTKAGKFRHPRFIRVRWDK